MTQNRSARGQTGSALMFTLVAISVLAIIGASLAAFGNASLRTTRAYDDVREMRYAADGAIKEAVNWIAKNDEVAVDPDYLPSANDDCVYHSESAQGEILTVSCETEPGSGAGIPPDPGIAPPESILLLGDRHNEPGPYSYEKCASLWDAITGWLNNDTPGQAERSFTAKQRQRSTWGGLGSCDTRERGLGPISVEGDINVAGRLQLADGFKLSVAGGDGGVVKAQYGCEGIDGNVLAPGGASISTDVQCNRADSLRPDDPDKDLPWEGKSIYADPGRIQDTATPINDIEDEFLPVGFDADGSVADGYTLPLRTKAYRYDDAVNPTGSATVPKHLVELPPSGAGACNIPAGTPVIFLWGRYTDAKTLNDYTANPACPDRTFWFAPNPGPDRELLTADDETAAFYLDFTNTASATKCGGMESSNPFRWCLGGASQNSSSKPRVVVGWPDDWTALPTTDPDGTGSGDAGYGQRVGVEMDTAGAIEGNFLTYWRNQGNAKVIDTQPSTYEPCRFWIFTCPSFGERSMRLAQFSPKVGGSPIAEDGLPNGRLFLDVHFAMRNADSTVPKVVVDYLDPRANVARTCGEFTLNLSAIDTNHVPGSAVPATSKSSISANDAAVLADNCGSVDAINNLRVTFKVEKNVWNTGSGVPTYDLDGVRVYYDSYQGASFPLPNECTDSDGDGDIDEFDTCGVPLSGVSNPVDPAKSDCDPSRPGGQLIFGGSTHVYAADGSLEVCGGPNPSDPQGAMVIGIYGVPGVKEVRAPNAPIMDNGSSGGSTSFSNPDYAKRIGEPLSLQASGVVYQGQCTGLLGIQSCKPKDGGAKELVYSFPGFTPPAGYRVSKVSARASYETEGGRFTIETGGDSSRLKVGGCNMAARQTRGELRQWANEPVGSSSPLVLYDGATRNCIPSPTSGTYKSGFAPTEVRWKPNVPSAFSFFVGGGCFVWIGWCNYDQDDLLDGVELDVEIEPIGTMSSDSDTSTPVLTPQSGCITAHPNYDGGQGPDYSNPAKIEYQNPDCALVRADSYTADGSDATDGGLCWGTCPGRRTNWFGRVSVKGTIYAPSAAVEIDDNDIGYPLATRGVILRHLRISGAKPRANFSDPLFGNQLDKEPNPRVAKLTACIQEGVNPASPRPCDPDVDRVVARSGVRFAADPTDPNPTAADVPEVEWYTDATTERQ
ncbi:MAG: hypothetical protein M9922_13770 [Microthrixaceae bacterium]|nr:hypothetical protein [Microthrixaceae bacterium]